MPFGAQNYNDLDRISRRLRGFTEAVINSKKQSAAKALRESYQQDVNKVLGATMTALGQRKVSTPAVEATVTNPYFGGITGEQTISPATEEMRYPSDTERDRVLDDATLKLLGQGNEVSDNAIKTVQLLRGRRDQTRTPFEAFAYGTPQEKRSAREWSEMTKKTTKTSPPRKIAEYVRQSDKKKVAMLWDPSKPEGQQFFEQEAEAPATQPKGAAGYGVGGRLTLAQFNAAEKERQQTTKDNYELGRKMTLLGVGQMVGPGGKDTIDPRSTEGRKMMENLQGQLKAKESRLQELTGILGGSYTQGSTLPAEGMTKDEFIEDFTNDQGREPTEEELDAAKEQGLWED